MRTPPGADANIYFPYTATERRLKSLVPGIKEMIYGSNEAPGAIGVLKDNSKPILFSMARSVIVFVKIQFAQSMCVLSPCCTASVLRLQQAHTLFHGLVSACVCCLCKVYWACCMCLLHCFVVLSQSFDRASTCCIAVACQPQAAFACCGNTACSTSPS